MFVELESVVFQAKSFPIRTIRTSAIIPAHNEEKTIGDVLAVVAAHPRIDETIVVCDACTDGTEAVAKRHSVRTIRTDGGKGKGAAMQAGVEAATGDVLFFFDADILDIRPSDIDRCLDALEDETVGQAVLLRGRGSSSLSAVMKLLPIVGGERALRPIVWDSTASAFKKGHSIEPALNASVKRLGLRNVLVEAPHVRHVIKERKWGVLKGVFRRVSTWTDIAVAYAKR